MAQAGPQQFEERLARIEMNRRKLKGGEIYPVNHDGLIIARPRRRPLHRRPLHMLVVLLVGVVLFKAALYGMTGAVTYNHRIAELANGPVWDQAAAWVMSADSLTQWLAQQGRMLFL